MAGKGGRSATILMIWGMMILGALIALFGWVWHAWLRHFGPVEFPLEEWYGPVFIVAGLAHVAAGIPILIGMRRRKEEKSPDD